MHTIVLYHTREKREYKYIVIDNGGHVKSWQPGSNCAVEVPSESDASLQVADDWYGKSRSVIYKNGEVRAAPSGTFDGPPAQPSTATAPTAAATQSAGFFPTQPTTEPSSASSSVSAQAPESQSSTQANGASQEPAAKPLNSVPESTLVDDESGVPLEDLPVKTLQKRLRGRKQKVSGNKAELIERLQSPAS